MSTRMTERAGARKSEETSPDPLIAAERERARLLAEALVPLLAPLLAAREPEPEYRDEVAEARRLDVSVVTIRRLVDEGLPHVYVGDRRRYRAADVDAWLRSRGRP